MDKNQAFFNKMANHILTECKSKADFIDAYEKVCDYTEKNSVEEWQLKKYIESGAAELLMMITQDYRKEKNRGSKG